MLGEEGAGCTEKMPSKKSLLENVKIRVIQDQNCHIIYPPI